MKKIYYFLLALCVASSLFISCKKDDDSKSEPPVPVVVVEEEEEEEEEPDVIIETPSNSTLLLGKWAEVESIEISDGTTYRETYEHSNPACLDYKEFKTLGILEDYYFLENCDLDVKESGSWSTTNDNLVLSIYDDVINTKIISLDQNNLIIELEDEYVFDVESPSDQLSYRVVFKKI